MSSTKWRQCLQENSGADKLFNEVIIYPCLGFTLSQLPCWMDGTQLCSSNLWHRHKPGDLNVMGPHSSGQNAGDFTIPCDTPALTFYRNLLGLGFLAAHCTAGVNCEILLRRSQNTERKNSKMRDIQGYGQEKNTWNHPGFTAQNTNYVYCHCITEPTAGGSPIYTTLKGEVCFNVTKV